MTRHIIATFLFLFGVVAASAQSRISVKEETYDDMETTAMVNPEKDRNNRDCALVIFHNVEPDGYYFDAGSIFIKAENRTSRDTGEKTVFLHISEGAKLINIRHRNDGIMSLRYEFANGPLQARHTYHVFLGTVVPANANAKQYLRFKITPPTAIIEVEEEPGVYTPWLVDASTGKASKKLPLGEYNYRVQARRYHSTAGKAVMTDASQACDETVVLKPAYGILAIAPIAGAQVFVDSENMPDYGNIHLDPGQHSVMIQRPKYKPFRTTVTIAEGQTTRLTPDFEANFGTVRLQASAPDVTIALRDGAGADRTLGIGSWSGDLDADSYTVVSSAPGHRESVYTITVPAGAQNLAFTLPAPTPIYGSLDISSTPDGATIKVDGKIVGQTPLQINNVLVGKHTVELTLTGKQPFTASVNVQEGKTNELNGELKDIQASISPTPQNNNSDESEKLHKVNNFYDLPDFIVHPLGYDGPWDFTYKPRTQEQLVNYFKRLDNSFYISSKIWLEDKSKHYQKIGKYTFEYDCMGFGGNTFYDKIIISYTTKERIFDQISKYLKDLNPEEARTIYGKYEINNIVNRIKIRISKTDSGTRVTIEYKF